MHEGDARCLRAVVAIQSARRWDAHLYANEVENRLAVPSAAPAPEGLIEFKLQPFHLTFDHAEPYEAIPMHGARVTTSSRCSSERSFLLLHIQRFSRLFQGSERVINLYVRVLGVRVLDAMESGKFVAQRSLQVSGLHGKC